MSSQLLKKEETHFKAEKERLKQFIKGTLKTKDSNEIKQISHFVFLKTLGEGTFGKVKLGVHKITN